MGHYDLLMDLHNQAKASGLNKVASSALEKAEQISEYSSSRSRKLYFLINYLLNMGILTV